MLHVATWREVFHVVRQWPLQLHSSSQSLESGKGVRGTRRGIVTGIGIVSCSGIGSGIVSRIVSRSCSDIVSRSGSDIVSGIVSRSGSGSGSGNS